MAATLADWTQVLDDADDVTAALLVQLSLEDAEEFAAEQSAAGNYHSLDAVVAREAFEQELKMYRCRRHLPSPPPPSPPPPPPIECTVCTSARPRAESLQAPCEHWYCNDCLTDLFRRATTDESLYPPRCCRQHIPFEDVTAHISTEVKELFEGKREELDDRNRIYCHVPACSTYIGAASRDGDKGTCPACEAATCIHCKNEAHSGVCGEDEAVKATLALAAEQNWQRCPSCTNMIELAHGCYHMT